MIVDKMLSRQHSGSFLKEPRGFLAALGLRRPEGPTVQGAPPLRYATGGRGGWWRAGLWRSASVFQCHVFVVSSPNWTFYCESVAAVLHVVVYAVAGTTRRRLLPFRDVAPSRLFSTVQFPANRFYRFYVWFLFLDLNLNETSLYRIINENRLTPC